jgi:hypothetical protein
MSAVKVLAEVLTLTLATELDWTWEAGPGVPESGAETVRGIAEHLVEVIAADPRVAVVALPELGGEVDDDGQVWIYGNADLRVDTTSQGRPTIHNLANGNEVTPERLRQHAVALLAAARAAGGDDQ